MSLPVNKRLRSLVLAGLVLALALPCWGAERLAVSAASAKVRTGPGTQFEVLWQVDKFHPLLVVKKQGAWCQVQDYEGDQGWLPQSVLSKINTVITAKSQCQVRAGPGTKFKVLTTLGQGIAFKVLQKQQVWLYVEHADGDKGWIHASLVW